jgi:hypothetical protein
MPVVALVLYISSKAGLFRLGSTSSVQSGVWVRRGKPGPGACVAQGGRGRARFGPPPRFLSLTRLSHISEQQQQVYTEKENPEGGPAARSPTRLLLVAARAAAGGGGGGGGRGAPPGRRFRKG